MNFKSFGAVRSNYSMKQAFILHQLAQMRNNENAKTKQIVDMSKSESRIATGLLTGHCKLEPTHLAQLRPSDDPDCNLCGYVW